MDPVNLDPERIFPSGTREIYAIWDYADMSEEMMVRREWWKNEELWLVREEP